MPTKLKDGAMKTRAHQDQKVFSLVHTVVQDATYLIPATSTFTYPKPSYPRVVGQNLPPVSGQIRGLIGCPYANKGITITSNAALGWKTRGVVLC